MDELHVSFVDYYEAVGQSSQHLLDFPDWDAMV
jgi:hypothetical protein